MEKRASLGAPRRRSGGNAFQGMLMVEALLLLIVIMLLVAVVVAVFGFSYTKGVEAFETSVAIREASNAAERFAADPEGVLPRSEVDGYVVTCDTRVEPTKSGEMHYATISVSRDEETLYQLETSKYLPSGALDASGAAVSGVLSASDVSETDGDEGGGR